MSDPQLRQLDREAVQGDIDARVRVYAHHLRLAKPCCLPGCWRCLCTGSLWSREHVKLAAFAGDEAALTLFDCQHDDLRDGDRACVCWYGRLDQGRLFLERWIGALVEVWGTGAALASAIGVARRIERSQSHDGCYRWPRGVAAVCDAAQAWLDSPCKETRDAWELAFEALPSDDNDNDQHSWPMIEYAWCPGPPNRHTAPEEPHAGSYSGSWKNDIGRASNIIGRSMALAVAKKALREWLLRRAGVQAC